ncbi:hypothetical protein [Pseudofulvimonas gallinarii]|jgi:hypothetical protein|uniref:Uncharacterized protein n=1 Tax=Pseudofulvimonas gallinarii TaxID=634155 RepID=A0A4R3LIX6_9GAMM|nr:hypothetical protein [Pseudofulvimonas gallinarii]TCT00103.1 hypothetical protein EDC25_10493 [Pseudofulvimonas gallinarii]
MNRIQSSMAALLITTASLAAPSIQAGESHAMPAASWADIQARGHLLFQHDRALAAAQRRAQASRTFTHDDRVVTAVSEKIDESLIRVTFVDATPAALYRVDIELHDYRSGPLEVFATPAALGAYQRKALAARAVAEGAQVDTCGHDTRSIVLPDPTARGQWQVYLLPQASDHGSIPVGGSHRIDTDGREVLARHAIADTCIELDRSDASIGVMVAANPGDPAPTEAHVYWSLWAALPMYVGTETGLWSISDGAIEPPTALNALRSPGFDAYSQIGVVHAVHAPMP